MREILFRGKRKDNGEWEYGFFIGRYDPLVEQDTVKYGEIDNGTIFFEPVKVDLETVGQYTGLTANGTKVFEGDILKIQKISNGIDYYFPPLPYPVNVVVKWDLCAWMWETLCEDKRYLSFPDAWCHFKCEVIGNIHDNPELLSGAKMDGGERE